MSDLGPAEELLTDEEIYLENHEDDPSPHEFGDLEDGHLEAEDYWRKHPDA